MNDPLDRLIADYYRSLNPPIRITHPLVTTALGSGSLAGRGGAAGRRIVAWGGVAAGLAATFLAGLGIGSQGRNAPVPTPPSREAVTRRERPSTIRPGRVTADEIARSSESADPNDLRGKPALATIPYIGEVDRNAGSPLEIGMPRLILAQISAEWCPRSPAVRPIFDELARKHANESLILVTFDVTDAERRRQAAYLAHALGVLEIMGHKWEPGMIQLIDTSTGEIIESLRTADDAPRIEHAIAAILVPNR